MGFLGTEFRFDISIATRKMFCFKTALFSASKSKWNGCARQIQNINKLTNPDLIKKKKKKKKKNKVLDTDFSHKNDFHILQVMLANFTVISFLSIFLFQTF